MSYSVKKNKDNRYEIFENGDDKSIFIHRSERTARSLCRKLNLGAGFNGFTPDFFKKKMG